MSPLPEVLTASREPIYNIGVVSRMTGVSMATLRAWERRYHFPDSERTSGGHRLYSERDVLRLYWVRERIAEGLQTAQAINALHHQEQSGQLSLIEQIPVLPQEMITTTSAHLLNYMGQLTSALVNGELEKADMLLGEGLVVTSPEDLILDVIRPTLASVGDAWESGQINVATEHLATNFLRQRVLMWMANSPSPKSIDPIILACAPGEFHEGSLLILGALLRRRRWPIAYLGQAVPLDDLAGFAHDLHPSMIILVAMTENSATEILDWPNRLPETARTGKPMVAYGGRIFTQKPEWRTHMTGFYLGDDLRTGLASIEKLMIQIY